MLAEALVVIFLWVGGMLIVSVLVWRWWMRRQLLERVFPSGLTQRAGSAPWSEEEQGFLTRWLFLAGFRAPGAALLFVALVLLALCAGSLGLWLLYWSGT